MVNPLEAGRGVPFTRKTLGTIKLSANDNNYALAAA